MKKIEAIISPNAVDSVVALLNQQSISNFIISNIAARNAWDARTQMYRGLAYAVDLSPEVKVEVVVLDNQASATAYAILAAAREPDRSFKPRVIITPVAEVIVELRDPTSNGSGDLKPGPHRLREELPRDGTAALALTAVTASAWTTPLHLAKRITTILAGYLRGRMRAGAPQTSHRRASPRDLSTIQHAASPYSTTVH
ncbi:MAG TPA: P-II family nitrogen regulator [Candidatus Binataceae bacterium]|jgi:nitrogen regulatory protein P-II 1|nr:P-II family nitrogen regulator [Candidatus Binataceae bacterium]